MIQYETRILLHVMNYNNNLLLFTEQNCFNVIHSCPAGRFQNMVRSYVIYQTLFSGYAVCYYN